jgi:hypothetical protein
MSAYALRDACEYACVSVREAKVRRLLEQEGHAADMDEALVVAAMEGREAVVRLLLQAPRAYCQAGLCAAIFAAFEYGRDGTLRLLLDSLEHATMVAISIGRATSVSRTLDAVHSGAHRQGNAAIELLVSECLLRTRCAYKRAEASASIKADAAKAESVSAQMGESAEAARLLAEQARFHSG